MRIRLPNVVGGIAGGAMLAGLIVASTATSGLAALATQKPAAPSAASAAATGGVTVPLVTGGQVTITHTPSSGGRAATVLRASGTAADGTSYESFLTGRDWYMIPAAAEPYLGRGLSQSLFDVSALARDGITGSARLPVTLRFASGVTAKAPPGVTLTAVHGTLARGEVADGFLTARSGNRFAAALHHQATAQMTARRPASTWTLPGGAAAMSLAAPGAPAEVTPHTTLHTLQFDVKVLPQDEVVAGIFVTDTDNGKLLTKSLMVQNGQASVSVPAGDYSAVANFYDFEAANRISTHFVLINDFKVSATAKVTTEHINEAEATSQITASTPKPATEDMIGVDYYRTDPAGKLRSETEFFMSNNGGVPAPLYVNAQPAAKVGTLHFVAQWDGTGTSTAHPYLYDVAYGSDTVPANEHYIVHSADLATVHQQFNADPAAGSTTGWMESVALDPWAYLEGYAFLVDDVGAKISMPATVTDYVGNGDGGLWTQTGQTPSQIIFDGDPVTFQPGHQYTVSWAHGPLAPTLGTNTGPQPCYACTAGSTLTLGFAAFGDSQPGQTGGLVSGGGGSYRFTFYMGSKKLGSGSGLGVTATGIPDKPETYRAVATTNLSEVAGFSQSTQTVTDLTVPYKPKAPGAALPGQDWCAGQTSATPCKILPALTLLYHLASNELNTSTAATQTMGLQVGHVTYNGAGSNAAIKSVSVSVSFNGGKTWQKATVTGSAGNYTADWANPASAQGTDPSLRITATDALGGSITQTITNAYTIAKSS